MSFLQTKVASGSRDMGKSAPERLESLARWSQLWSKVHVWAGISKSGATEVLIFTGIMKKEFYVTEILKGTLLPFIRETFPDGHCFQQDNDPKHKSECKMFILPFQLIYCSYRLLLYFQVNYPCSSLKKTTLTIGPPSRVARPLAQTHASFKTESEAHYQSRTCEWYQRLLVHKDHTWEMPEVYRHLQKVLPVVVQRDHQDINLQK